MAVRVGKGNSANRGEMGVDGKARRNEEGRASGWSRQGAGKGNRREDDGEAG